VLDIIGVEISNYFTKLQTHVLKDVGMTDRISIKNCDIVSEDGLALLTGKSSLFPAPNVVVFNNVFQFFVGEETSSSSSKGKGRSSDVGGREKIREIWETLKGAIEPGCVLVAIPSLEQQFEDVGMDWDKDWVEVIEMDEDALDDFQESLSLEDYMLDDIRDINLYRVSK
jgi:hypothetical protein